MGTVYRSLRMMQFCFPLLRNFHCETVHFMFNGILRINENVVKNLMRWSKWRNIFWNLVRWEKIWFSVKYLFRVANIMNHRFFNHSHACRFSFSLFIIAFYSTIFDSFIFCCLNFCVGNTVCDLFRCPSNNCRTISSEFSYWGVCITVMEANQSSAQEHTDNALLSVPCSVYLSATCC
jgi:hypothetical protein